MQAYLNINRKKLALTYLTSLRSGSIYGVFQQTLYCINEADLDLLKPFFINNV